VVRLGFPDGESVKLWLAPADMLRPPRHAIEGMGLYYQATEGLDMLVLERILEETARMLRSRPAGSIRSALAEVVANIHMPSGTRIEV
jgi:hypothetical protein